MCSLFSSIPIILSTPQQCMQSVLKFSLFLKFSQSPTRFQGVNYFQHCRDFRGTLPMANSRWDYVKTFEAEEVLLPNCWSVARIDGRGFHRLAKKHNWKRPNDSRGLNLMTKAAKVVMRDFNDIILAYGQSDEYSFIFRREAEVFQRRSAKIITTLVSKFSSAFVFHWKDYFPDIPLEYPPSFDGRMVLYPTDQNLRDYLCWRQADCHINNLYNTTFWALVLQGGLSNNDAQRELSGTLSGDKNEILFSRFGINYNNEPEVFRKGTVLVSPPPRTKNNRPKPRADDKDDSKDATSSEELITVLNCDIIGQSFWNEYPYLLNPKISNSSTDITDSIANKGVV